jgi:alkylhydroperoxidase/carboxymuconolactone decarboxylase family protein YurZ
MEKQTLPKHYLAKEKKFKEFFDALENLGKVTKKQGPLDEKTAQLIQLAAAAAITLKGLFTAIQEELLKQEQSPRRFITHLFSSQLPLAFQPLLLL